MSNIQLFEAKGQLAPASLQEAMEFSKFIANSNMIPSAFKGKPADILLAMQMGAGLGLAPMQALQNIAVINGRPGIFGDAALALVQGSGLLDDIEETLIDDVATCRVRRKNRTTETTGTFSVEDAKRAGLWEKRSRDGKPTPWVQYPQRMLQMRARSFALRDAFPDVLMGLGVVEELQDIPVDEPRQSVRAQSIATESDAVEEAETVDMATEAQQEQIKALCKKVGMDGKELGQWMIGFSVKWAEMTSDQAEDVIVRLTQKHDELNPIPAAPVRWEGFDATIKSTSTEMSWTDANLDIYSEGLIRKKYSELEGAADVALYKTLSSAMVAEFNKYEDAKEAVHA